MFSLGSMIGMGFAIGTPFRAAYTLSTAQPPLPSIAAEPLYWVTSLASPDPTFVLPMCTTLAVVGAIELSMRDAKALAMPGQNQMMDPDALKRPLQILTCGFGLALGKDMPALMHALLLANTLFQFGQSRVLAHDGFRARVGLPTRAEMATLRAEASQRQGSVMGVEVGGRRTSSSTTTTVPTSEELMERIRVLEEEKKRVMAAMAVEKKKKEEEEGGDGGDHRSPDRRVDDVFVGVGPDGKGVALRSRPINKRGRGLGGNAEHAEHAEHADHAGKDKKRRGDAFRRRKEEEDNKQASRG